MQTLAEREIVVFMKKIYHPYFSYIEIFWENAFWLDSHCDKENEAVLFHYFFPPLMISLRSL